jgi:hypothetical protein
VFAGVFYRVTDRRRVCEKLPFIGAKYNILYWILARKYIHINKQAISENFVNNYKLVV